MVVKVLLVRALLIKWRYTKYVALPFLPLTNWICDPDQCFLTE